MIARKLSPVDICQLAEKMIRTMHEDLGDLGPADSLGGYRVYGIPRGGIPVALACRENLNMVDSPELAEVFVDDIIDSGKTRDRYTKAYPGVPFYALVDKTKDGWETFKDEWIVFPWEGTEEASIEDAFTRLLQYIGEDVKRGGLVDTPVRMAKAWREWTSGYNVEPSSVLKVFEDGAAKYDELILVQDIPFYSHCEHHLAPFFGTVTIGYIPQGKIVGLSKLGRVVDIFAKRLQVQERFTCQVADSIKEVLAPKGVGVVVRARHLCMESRGICKQGHHTTTSALRGVLFDNDKARAEFLSLARC